MQAMLCDICDQPVHGRMVRFDLIPGEAVSAGGATARIVLRPGGHTVHMCSSCGDWMRRAMEQLRVAHQQSEGTRQTFWAPRASA